jgi:hypothetical protein
MDNLPTNCVHCGRGIDHSQTKPGKINECGECGSNSDIERLGGNMVWTSKHAPELEIKPMTQAVAFAKKQRRFGAGVTASIVQGQMTGEERELSGNNSEAAPGATWRSPLGEKHSVKR